MSRFTKLMLMLLLASVAAVGQDPMYARDYYAELVKTHSLSGFENEYSCFSDDSADGHFFIFTTSDTLRRVAQVEAASDPSNKKKTVAFKALADLKGDFIVRLDYFKGLSTPSLFMDKDKDSESYSAARGRGKITLSVNLKTGRYRDELHSTTTSMDGLWQL